MDGARNRIVLLSFFAQSFQNFRFSGFFLLKTKGSEFSLKFHKVPQEFHKDFRFQFSTKPSAKLDFSRKYSC